MRYLILFEWDKSVDEITFVYQNTMNYRKSEQKLKRNILIYYALTNFIGITGVLSNSTYDSVYSYEYPCDEPPKDAGLEDKYDTWLKISLSMILSVIGFTCIFGTATFIHLFNLMRKRHFFEF